MAHGAVGAVVYAAAAHAPNMERPARPAPLGGGVLLLPLVPLKSNAERKQAPK